jgi:NAD(P)-dependent dehydrogenase (short-subunit alcohol dehydrogenase family)
MSERRSLKDKTVIITGASAGLGRATALAFAAQGARVGLMARSDAGLADTAAELTRAGHKAFSLAPADVADADAVSRAAEKIEGDLGPVDIWVNNAMATLFSALGNITADEFRRVTDVTYHGAVYGTMEALRRMRRRDSGHIIQVGSALAYRGIPLQTAYCGAKHAIRGFTDALRCELIHDKSGIKITSVHMPALNTPQFEWARTHIRHHPEPVGKIYQPETGAQAIIRAALKPRREYWVGRVTWEAIIGNKLLPGWMDRKMARDAYEAQWIKDEPMAERAGNLFEPVPGHKTHGRFDDQASR